MPKQTEVNFSDVDSMVNPFHAVEEMDKMRSQGGIQAIKTRALRYLDLKAGEKVLDIGCGSGDDVRRIAECVSPGGRVVGIDSSRTMIEAAEKRTPTGRSDVRYLVKDVHNLEFEDSTFDGVWCERTLQHVNDPARVIQESRRVLSDGGRMVLIDSDWETFVINHPDRALTRKILNSFCDSIAHGWSGRSLLGLCSRAGFKSTEIFAETAFSSDFNLLFEGMNFSGFLQELRTGGTLSEVELDRWSNDLKAADVNSTFFFAVTLFCVCARKN